MKQVVSNPQIELCNVKQNNCLKFSFNGILAEDEAREAVMVWKSFFNEKSGEKLTLIWDCNRMAGYDPGARIIWQNTLKELKDQISSIWLISTSSMIKSGAMIVSMITKLNIKVIQSENEILE